MALNLRNSKTARKQRGMSLVELMIALLVLLVGLVGSMSLVAISIGGNGRNKQQSNSTVISQMMLEKLSSQKASLSQNLTITDCIGNSTSTVFTSAGGSPLNGSGDVDYTQAAVTGYQMLYVDCGTRGRSITYDVRWNITQPTPYTKLVIVSTKMQNAGGDLKFFSLPVTVRSLVGQGT